VIRAVYFLIGVCALALGAYLRWAANTPAPWWLLVVAALAASAAFAHAVVLVLGRPSPFWLVAGVAVALLGWVLIAAGLAGAGGVAAHTDMSGACQYYLNDHGQKTCITRSEYEVEAAKGQSMGFGAAAFFLGFAVVAVAGKQDRTDDR
jgi:hypothetical protein